MISKTLAVSLGQENFVGYDVQAGSIATDMTTSVIAQSEQRANDGLTLFPRVGQSEGMGTIIAALAAGKLRYANGKTISAGAGMLAALF